MDSMNTIEDCLAKKTDLSQQELLWILEKITRKSVASLLAHKQERLTFQQVKTFNECTAKIVHAHYPLQYFLGNVPFGDMNFFVKPPVLIPRPETEEWVNMLIKKLKPFKLENLTILDMCTGSGCIAVLLAQALPKSTIYAVDVSSEALMLAQKNAEKNNITNIVFVQSDHFKNIDFTTQFDLFVSNPPYVTHSEFETLELNVKNWEDKQALVAEDNGLAFYKLFAKELKKYLKKESILNKKVPRIVMEIGHTQAFSIRNIFIKYGYKNIIVHKDIYGKDRTITLDYHNRKYL